MNSNFESPENTPTYRDVVRVAHQIIDSGILPLDYREYYIDNTGTISARMREEADRFYDAESEQLFEQVHTSYNALRAGLVNGFSDIDAEIWNKSPIGTVMRQISEILLRNEDKIKNKEPVNSSVLLYVMGAVTSLSELSHSKKFRTMDIDQKYNKLNEGARIFLEELGNYSNLDYLSSTVQIILALENTEDTEFAGLKQSHINLYPKLLKILDTVHYN